MNVESVEIMSEIRKSIGEKSQIPVVLSGCVGPRGDGYKVGSTVMTSQEAEDYHSKQIATMATKTEADLISAFTINYPEEAVGIVRACKKFDIPVVISFTVETNGKLPNGQSLKVSCKFDTK